LAKRLDNAAWQRGLATRLGNAAWQRGLATRLGNAAWQRGLHVFEFNRMPFGIVNATTTFQRAMDIVLSGLS
jgi:hypothetical protein